MSQAPPTSVQAVQRLDLWLWCARFARHRADCAQLVADGAVRLNRQPTEKPHARLRVGDVLTLKLRDEVLIVHVLKLAARRGPASEARLLYALLAPISCAAPMPCTEVESSAYAGPPFRPVEELR